MTTSALRTRTPEQREEINERARNWARPLTGPQFAALKLLGESILVVTRAGWQGTGIERVSTQTLVALESRGMMTFTRRGGLKRRAVARITAKGRDTLRRLA
jgi:hypothetical protein